MDFLDPKKQRRHTILLYAGYILIAVAILISTIVLVYQANGFGVNSRGQVTQNGLLFFSSQPTPADIYLNGKRNPDQTNTRVSVPAGQYNVRLTRSGYYDWQRSVTVQGGDVQNFDYPVLFPKQLRTTVQADYPAPGTISQTRDRRWLMVQQTPTSLAYDVYDLRNSENIEKKTISLPASVARGGGAGTWEVLQWGGDNRRVVLKHSYADRADFILFDREDPAASVNLNVLTNSDPAQVTLIDNKADQYHLLMGDGTLYTAGLDKPEPVKILNAITAYKSYGARTVLYATPAAENKTSVALFDGEKSTTVRTVTGNSNYQLDMAGFRGNVYVTFTVAAENTLYVYRDPIAQLKDPAIQIPVPLRALRIDAPSTVSFSPNTQYIVAENGPRFAVYDIYLKRAYTYTVAGSFDAPQTKASWMDGNRITYVSGGKQIVFDFDRRNKRTLAAANPAYLPFFSPNYNRVYNVAPKPDMQQVTQTPLLAPADL